MKLLSGRTTVSTLGFPRSLADRETPVSSVDIFALAANTGVVAIGDASVREQASQYSGWPLYAGECLSFKNIDLADIWVDVAVADEGVRWGATIDD